MSRVHRRNPRHGRRRSERPRFRWVMSVLTLLPGGGKSYSGMSVRTTKPRLETADVLRGLTQNWLLCEEEDLARNLADATDPNASEEDLLRAATSHPTEVRANPAASLFAMSNPTAWAAVLAPQPSQVGNPDKPREWFNRAARTSRMRREARRLLAQFGPDEVTR